VEKVVVEHAVLFAYLLIVLEEVFDDDKRLHVVVKIKEEELELQILHF